MTPKEKAIELINKMNNVDLNCANESMCMLYSHAIKCALIAVDTVLKNRLFWKEDYQYWKEVKNEIENKINKIN